MCYYYILCFYFQNLKSLTWNPQIKSQAALETLFPAMPHMTNLTLTTEEVYGDGYEAVLRAIAANLHHLKYLDISYKNVVSKAIEYLLPTDDNALGGCPELVDLNLRRIQNVDVELLKKIILALPKLRSLTHELLVNALGNLTEEEMGVDTAGNLNTLCARNVPEDSENTRFDKLATSPAFQQFRNNVTTVDIDAPIAKKGQRESALLADVLMWLPKLKWMVLGGVSEAHDVLSLLETFGDRLELLKLFDLSGNLSVQDIMMTCSNLEKLNMCHTLMENDLLVNNIKRQHDQAQKLSKLPELDCLAEICLHNMNKDLCSADMLTALLQSSRLEQIELRSVEAMTDDVMFNVLSSRGCAALSKVTRFVITGCSLITAAPFEDWLTRDNCSLHYMFINKCEKVDDKTLRDAVVKCPKTVIVKQRF